MLYRELGDTGLKVSLIGLGTMTWGEQNTQEEAHEQMDYALSRGVNFFDAAELYPVPPKASTSGATERIIGAWFSARKNRSRVILATKVTGRSGMDWIRGGSRLTPAQIVEACDGSLQRLSTDYIDVYQLHWPDRTTNFFSQLDYTGAPDPEDVTTLAAQLEALGSLVKAGKVRHIGLSNETPWGVMHCLHLAESRGLPRVVSVQNPYNLLNRSFDVGLAEVAMRERCGLLAYSPLGFGVLTGKYLDKKPPPGGRLTLFGAMFGRYTQPLAVEETKKYVAIAKKYGLEPTAMALAFVNSRPWLTSNLIGATSIEQLDANISSAFVTLPQEALAEIDALHKAQSNPCP
ncbi:MAG: aldo/keto reductase [Alphaproteobacteria bacterium GM202ARS2]|nr:aldo/keto reductase [Alphaproteobacteria bacterium GM202ARS2]